MNKNIKIQQELIATITGFTYSELKEEKVNKKGEKYMGSILDENNNPIPDFSKVQIQSQFKDIDGVEQKYTFKLNIETKFEQMKALKGKTFKFEGVKENEIFNEGSKFPTITYSVKKIGEEVKVNEKMFSYRKTLTAILSSVVETEIKDWKTKEITGHNTTFQVVSETETPFGIKSDLKNIVLKDTRAEKYKSLAGKKVNFENIKIYAKNGKVSFTIEKAPTEVK
jgi:hypothetical protein